VDPNDHEPETPHQRAALAAVRARGSAPEEPLGPLARAIAEHACVTLNFHPYRRLADGKSVAEGLLSDGVYRGQFETGISNGGATAYPGGARDNWEDELFEGAYRGAASATRPKYGALALMRHADGAAPRFGCCYLRLRPTLSHRCTFTWGDSHDRPSHVGTVDALGTVLGALMDDVRSRGATLGASGLDERALLERLLRELPSSARTQPSNDRLGRALDEYIEAQVHGPVSLHRDVDALVADAALRGTDTGAVLERVAETYHLAFHWHPGFRLVAASIPDDFRGPRVPALARRLGAPAIDASVLALAAQSMHIEPARWRDWAEPEDTLQHLKQLWHCLVAFGDPVLAPGH
jgi:hypothetical protein